VVAFVVAVVVAPRAHAEPAGDAVALLPLDADKSLEIYGQPVASEIARALVAGSVQVVVVGPRMAVPERARLIIDGTIAQGRASAVTISLRIRNTTDGTVVDNLSATAPGLAKIDSAAGELSSRILPIVKTRLAALRRPPEDHGRVTEGRPAPAPAPDRPVLVAVSDARGGASPGPLRGALDTAVIGWAASHHRKVQTVEPSKLGIKAIAAGGAELALGLWVVDWSVERMPAAPGAPVAQPLAMARAKVRVQLTGAAGVLFDRVVVTDTVLGEPGLGDAELAVRVAREVLAILRPHMRRSVPSWQ
jgi:hypothetical protein